MFCVCSRFGFVCSVDVLVVLVWLLLFSVLVGPLFVLKIVQDVSWLDKIMNLLLDVI